MKFVENKGGNIGQVNMGPCRWKILVHPVAMEGFWVSFGFTYYFKSVFKQI